MTRNALSGAFLTSVQEDNFRTALVELVGSEKADSATVIGRSGLAALAETVRRLERAMV
jgi:hypothetical protein